MIIVFDLDDTLYDELTYVRSGFQAVAEYLWAQYRLPVETSFLEMAGKLSGGRGRIFDDVLRESGLFSKSLVRKCLAVYRGHSPKIHLAGDADACLDRLQLYPRYIVTDGNKMVQANKIKALGLETKVNDYYITHRYGKRHAKPSPYCFLQICKREGVPPADVLYVGDNPHKDFVGIKPLGFKTVRIMQGQHREAVRPPEYEADLQIASLDQLTPEFLETLNG